MRQTLTKAQRRGTALFLGLCLVCLAAALLRGRTTPEPPPDTAAETALRERLNALHTPADTVAPEAPRSHGKERRKKAKRRDKKPERRPSAPAAPPQDPFAPVPGM